MEVAEIIRRVSGTEGSARRDFVNGLEGAVTTTGGCFGSVAVFDEIVVKVWTDDSYGAWLEFVLGASPEKSYFPHLPRVIWADMKARVVILERLYERPWEYEWRIRSDNRLSPLHRGGRPWQGFDNMGYDYDTVRHRKPQWARDLIDDMTDLRLKYSADGHRHNWMIRKEGHRRRLVITDPIC